MKQQPSVETWERDGKTWRACTKCGNAHDRGRRYSYCRPCFQVYRRAWRGNVKQSMRELADRVACLERCLLGCHGGWVNASPLQHEIARRSGT